MIETISDIQQFKAENNIGDLFLHVVALSDDIHPADNTPSIIFINNLYNGKTYCFSIDHPDSIPEISKEDFLKVLGSLTNIKWVVDKKAFTQLTGISNVYDVNLAIYLDRNSIINVFEYDTSAHHLVRRFYGKNKRINVSIPIMKHMESFNDLLYDVKNIIKKFEFGLTYKPLNDLIIDPLGKMESNGIYVDSILFNKFFTGEANKDGLVYSKYNVYTSTGRPSNAFGGINYAALNNKDESRSCFVSRHGKDGKIILIDYTAFHPRIICYLIKYDIPPETDIYEYLAKLYFQKKNVDETDLQNSKKLTFKQLYGKIEDKYCHIKYLSSLKLFIDEQWDFFNRHGYVETPIFKRKITNKHIKDPNPNKLFNYILQAMEGEIAIPKIKEVQEHLKNKKTKDILYTYDSVLFDFHKEDGIEILNEIRTIMSYNGKFPIKTYGGDSYNNVKLMSI